MIDLHTHTNNSDGDSTIHELLQEAEEKGLTMLSITDHNTVRAYKDLEKPEARSLFSGLIIPGVEITATYNGETVEVLGYGFDIPTMEKLLESHVLTFRQKQLNECELIREKYKKTGIKFDDNCIVFNPDKFSSREAFLNEIIKYPENYKFFLLEESRTSIGSFSRNEVYNPKSPLYVDESSLYPSLDVAIEMIHTSGGLAFFAHTYAYSSNIPEALNDIIDNYKLDGLECYYTTFTNEQTQHLIGLCQKKNLFMSGGSDFHGTRKTKHYLGIGDGSLIVDDSVATPWLSRYFPKDTITYE